MIDFLHKKRQPESSKWTTNGWQKNVCILPRQWVSLCALALLFGMIDCIDNIFNQKQNCSKWHLGAPSVSVCATRFYILIFAFTDNNRTKASTVNIHSNQFYSFIHGFFFCSSNFRSTISNRFE